MSAFPFNPRQGPIIVETQATGPTRTGDSKPWLDTGATTSLVDIKVLLYLGFDLNQPFRRIRMVTGSGMGMAPVFGLTRFSALGQHRFPFPVIGHTLPTASAVDGLLGLDFLRDQVLTIDFRTGQITLV